MRNEVFINNREDAKHLGEKITLLTARSLP